MGLSKRDISLVVLAACLVFGWAASGARAAAITEFTAGLNAGASPSVGAVGPDGNTWFDDFACYYGSGQCAIGKITPSGAITEFPLSFTPDGLVVGADGNFWTFSFEGSPEVIERITPAGTVTSFTQNLQSNSYLTDMVEGADGNIWFTDEACTESPSDTCAIGKITPSGTITEYPLPSGAIAPDLVAGPGGNIWFTDHGTPAIGMITPSGTITEYTADLNTGALPYNLVVGPDGNIWFIDNGTTPAIGRVTPSGTITEYTTGLLANAYPEELIAGPDGNVWFIDDGCDNKGTCAIGQITPSGTITEFTAGLVPGSYPDTITVGVDGNIWFTANNPAAIGRITPSGTITELTAGLPSNSDPSGIVTGSDGNLWFGDSGTPAIGQVALQLAPAVTTGAASDVTDASAIVVGTVNPLGGAVSSVGVQWGTTTAYGEGVLATPATLAAGGTPVTVGAGLTGLPPGTTIHYRVVATNAYGTTVGSDQTLTTSPAPVAPLITPTITRLRQSASKWRTGSAFAKIAKKSHVPTGTTFTLTLSEPATLKLAFTHGATGHRSGKRCSTTKKHGHKCTATVSAGTITLTGHAGTDKITFAGRIKGHKTLKPGRYTVTFTATTAGKTSSKHTLTFTIVK